MMKKVAILLSTYNGEKYLREQIESLLNLKKEDFELFIKIRDDGSNDSTQEILNEYCKKNSNIEWYQGDNKGPGYSFCELLFKQTGFDYYAFCDQDDFWEEEKINVAIDKLREISNKPALYFSAVNVVDKDLKFINKHEPTTKLSFENSFILNPVVGCTLVFNDKLKSKLEQIKLDGEIGMHDSLIYRVAQSIDAKIIYDENSYIKYRQHGNNVLGINKSKKGLLNSLDYFIKPRKKIIANVAKLILETYKDELGNEKINVLKDIENLSGKNKFKSKLKILLNNNFKSGNLKQDIKFKYDIVFNRK